MKRIIVHVLAASLLATSVAAQAVMRPRPGAVVMPAPKVTQQTISKSLDARALSARLRQPPSFIPPQQLRNFGAIIIGQLNAPFSLTPLAPDVPERGKLVISGDISSPNPPPPGFPGQAVLRYHGGGLGTGVWYFGHVTLTIYAKKDKNYAVDCLAVVDAGRVNFKITGNQADMEGKTDPKNGHLFFNVRRSTADGPITLYFHPDPLVQEAKNPLQPNFMTEKNVMDFWGCQVTPSG
jgi:hypothetical protein